MKRKFDFFFTRSSPESLGRYTLKNLGRRSTQESPVLQKKSDTIQNGESRRREEESKGRNLSSLSSLSLSLFVLILLLGSKDEIRRLYKP